MMCLKRSAKIRKSWICSRRRVGSAIAGFLPKIVARAQPQMLLDPPPGRLRRPRRQVGKREEAGLGDIRRVGRQRLPLRSEEPTNELQPLQSISYDAFSLYK